MIAHPTHRAHRQPFVERHQVRRRQMNATGRLWTTQRGLVTETMDVNVAAERINAAAAIVSRLQSFEPEDPMHHAGVGLPAPRQPNGLPASKDCPNRMTAAHLQGNPMEAQRSLVRIHALSDPKA